MKLSILMPVFNEAATVATAVKRVLDVDYPCEVELVVVDDGSSDGTADVLAGLDDPESVATGTRRIAARGRRCAPRPSAPPATTW